MVLLVGKRSLMMRIRMVSLALIWEMWIKMMMEKNNSRRLGWTALVIRGG
jgi:hypothetical protein